MGLGLCNAPPDGSEVFFSVFWLIVLGTVDALEVPPVNPKGGKKRVRMLILGISENFIVYYYCKYYHSFQKNKTISKFNPKPTL